MVFSIIIPVYNVESYIRECIDSILPQITENAIDAEILLIDDGSTDKSGEMCDRYAEQYPELIRVLHKENEGLLRARRSGFALAKGDYIVNCDSDDILAEDALSTLQERIDALRPDVLLYNMGIYDGSEKKPFYADCFTDQAYTELCKEQVLRSYFTDDIPVVTSMAGKAIKRSCLDLHRDYSSFSGSSFGEDTLQSAEVYEHAETIVYINRTLYYYRTSTGMTAKFNEDYYDNFLRILNYVSAYPYIAANENAHSWFTIKLLKTLARSITQSKNGRGMDYRSRKRYLEALSAKERVQDILRELGRYKRELRPKQRLILFLFKHKLFICIHAALSL